MITMQAAGVHFSLESSQQALSAEIIREAILLLDSFVARKKTTGGHVIG